MVETMQGSYFSRRLREGDEEHVVRAVCLLNGQLCKVYHSMYTTLVYTTDTKNAKLAVTG